MIYFVATRQASLFSDIGVMLCIIPPLPRQLHVSSLKISLFLAIRVQML